MNALFNVYKPKGPTSHDVVARIRRASGVKRVGHAGTLDPLAEGVLLIAVGQATRVLEYLTSLDKGYLAEVTFGVETNTYDAEGQVVATRPTDGLTRERIVAALGAFRGEIEQRPPAYSAISVGGRRLYDLARHGKPVDAPLRRVTISRLELVEWSSPVARLCVACSKGTYIRSLAHDLGQALGTGAYLSVLARLRVGGFLAHNAVPLSELEDRLRSGRWQDVALPPDAALSHLPRIELSAADGACLARGMAIPAAAVTPEPGHGIPARPHARAYAGGAFVAIVKPDRSDGRPVWQPVKVFARHS